MDELPYNCVGTTSYPLRKKIKSDPYVRICTKKNSKWIQYLSKRKLEKSLGESFNNFLEKVFLTMPTKP